MAEGDKDADGTANGAGKNSAPSWRLDSGKSMGLADEYEYVMYGKVRGIDQRIQRYTDIHPVSRCTSLMGKRRRGCKSDRRYCTYCTENTLRSTAYASFGGLLMALTGAYRHVSAITVGDNVYLLARK